MFGIIYLTYGAVMSAIGAAGRWVRDVVIRSETLDANTGLYNDSKMHYYDATMGGKQVIFETHVGGRAVTRDIRTYKILRDITQEAMDKELAYYKANPDPNHTVVKWSTREDAPDPHNNKDLDKPLGTRYKDVKTGAIYVKRCFSGRRHNPFEKKHNREEYCKRAAIYPISTFYMDIDTGMLTRVQDGTYENEEKNLIKECRYTPEEIEKKIAEKKEQDDRWIKTFNKEQKENIEKGMKEVNGYRFYCNNEMRDW